MFSLWRWTKPSLRGGRHLLKSLDPLLDRGGMGEVYKLKPRVEVAFEALRSRRGQRVLVVKRHDG